MTRSTRGLVSSLKMFNLFKPLHLGPSIFLLSKMGKINVLLSLFLNLGSNAWNAVKSRLLDWKRQIIIKCNHCKQGVWVPELNWISNNNLFAWLPYVSQFQNGLNHFLAIIRSHFLIKNVRLPWSQFLSHFIISADLVITP